MGKIIPIVVTSQSEDGAHYKSYSSAPIVRYVDEEKITVSPARAANGSSVIREYKPNGGYYEYKSPIKPDDIEVLRNPGTTDFTLLSRKAVAQSANGTNQSTTLTARRYTEVTTITAASAEAIKLPADPAANDCYMIVNNHATATLKVFPGVGDFINGQAVNTSVDILPGARAFFVRVSADNWKTAVDYGR